MSQITTPDGAAGHRGDAPVHHNEDSTRREAIGSSRSGSQRRRVLALVAGGIVCVIALVFLAGGGWALWTDRVDRDGNGFVSFGTNALRTEQYAIVGDLRGSGPSWLYGSTVLGDARVRATSQAEQPLFIGIAPKDDVLRYLQGVGYATIESFEVSAKTTHRGGVPSGPPSHQSIWAASTQGTGRQTLLWTPRAGDWSIVFMNADASANVDVRGDAGAKLPTLPWLAGGLLIIGGAAGFIGAWVLARGIRRKDHPFPAEPDESQESTTGRGPVGARSVERDTPESTDTGATAPS